MTLAARLNACVAPDGRWLWQSCARASPRYLGRGSLRLATAAAQGLTLPAEATAPMANAPYAEGARPYLPLLPLIGDRHVDALTLAGSKEEVAAHGLDLRRAGITSIIVRPLAGDGVTVEDTIAALGDIWPTIAAGG